MRICFLLPPIEYYSPISGGAIATIAMQSAQHLIARGHTVDILTVRTDDEVYPVGNIVFVEARTRQNLHPVQRKLAALNDRLRRWDWPYYQFYMWSFSKALKSLPEAPDAVIVFNDLVSARYIRYAAPASRIYVWLQNEQGTRQKELGASVACTTGFLTCSQYIKDWTVKRYGIGEEKFAVIHSGVDLKAFFPRQDYLAGDTPLRALFIGRIDPNKGPDIAADAVLALQKEGLPVELAVAGGLWFYGHGKEAQDPYFCAFKTKMDAAGADYRGHVIRPDVPDLLRQHDVAFVLSRSNEPFGLVALETMASGCAVIASNRGGLPEACGGAAILVDPDNFAAVVDILRELTTNATLLQNYKRKGVERAMRADWSSVAERLERVLQSDN